MDYPQIAGLRCSACNKMISSMAEGEFCEACCNPLHKDCFLPAGTSIPENHCDTCGADPHSAIAKKIRAEIDESLANGPRVVCPRCGSTHGFRPMRMESTGDIRVPLLIGYLSLILLIPYFLVNAMGGFGYAGELECFECQCVFQPRSRTREIGCVVLIALTLLGFVALMAYFVLNS